MKKYEKIWLDRINSIIEKNYQRMDFQLNDITNELEISPAKLRRNIRKLTGLTPGKYIKKIRLKKAKTLLEIGEYPTVKEISCEVGYRNPEYFTKLFYNTYQILPSKLLKA